MKKSNKTIFKRNKTNIDIDFSNNISNEGIKRNDILSLDENSEDKFEKPHYYQNKIKNPQITHFNKNSFFIYDNYSAKEYLDCVKNKNLIKLNDKFYNPIY